MTLLNFDTQIMKIHFNFFHISVDFKQLVWFKNHTSSHYLAEPPQLTPVFLNSSEFVDLHRTVPRSRWTAGHFRILIFLPRGDW